MAKFDAGTPATRYAQARAEGLQKGFFGDNADAYVRDNYPEIFAGRRDNVPDLSIAKNPELLAPIVQAHANTLARQNQAKTETTTRAQEVPTTQPSVEEGVNQSYLDVFKRPASQDEIDEYVREFGADNVYDAGEKAALESRLAAAVGKDIAGDAPPTSPPTFPPTFPPTSPPDSTVTSTRFSSSELGLDDTESKKTDTKISDLPTPRVVEDAPIATGLRQVFDQVVKRPPSAEDMDYYPDLYGLTLDFEERARLTRALRPEQLAMFRRELDIPTLDFTTFGAAPVTTGEGATAGIERLRLSVINLAQHVDLNYRAKLKIKKGK